MNAGLRALTAWAPRNLEQLLDELVALGRRFKADEAVRRPFVMLSLVSGRDLLGFVVDVHVDRGGNRTVLLHVPGYERQPDYHLAHVPWSRVEAITVHDVPSLEKPPSDAPAPPTPLQLKRNAAALQERLATALGRTLAVEVDSSHEAGRGALQHLLELLDRSLTDLSIDAMGKEALIAKVTGLRLSNAEAMRVQLSDGILSVTTPTAWNDRPQLEALKRALDALL